VSLAQVRTGEKSNKIITIPELIKALDLEGCIISIDTMGCQHAIADEIIQAKAQYVLAVKNNQQELYKALEDTFRFQCAKERISSHELNFGHDCIENRTCYTSQNIKNIDTTKCKNASGRFKF
jgi:predicted transposase YbfD/YdcC